jgi:hypothetical protein
MVASGRKRENIVNKEASMSIHAGENENRHRSISEKITKRKTRSKGGSIMW